MKTKVAPFLVTTRTNNFTVLEKGKQAHATLFTLFTESYYFEHLFATKCVMNVDVANLEATSAAAAAARGRFVR